MPLPSINQSFVIGIFGSNGKTSTSNMLYCIFNGAGYNVLMIDDKKNVAVNRNVPNIEQNKKLKNLENNDIILIEINEEMLENPNLYNIDFDMLIHCHISEESYEATKEGACRINSLINSSNKSKVMILNTDDRNWRNIFIDVENTCLITYGFGGKATVTASSVECGKSIKYLYCLQRSICDINGRIIEPMEVPVSISALGQYNVYNGLCAMTAALYCGVPIHKIVELLSNKIDGTGMELLYENGFGIAYNVCDNISSYESGFEAIQNLPYKNIYLVFGFSGENRNEVNEKIIDLIGAWSLTLKIKLTYFLNYDALPCQDVSELNNICNLKCIGGSPEDIEGIINSLRDDDLLLLFCSSSYKNLRDKIIDVLDKRILGVLSGYNV